MVYIGSVEIIDTAASHHTVCIAPKLRRSVSSVDGQHENRVKLSVLQGQ